ncbi:hypothetical protein PSN45_002114 [Yamadazyma tenuis]|uniref:Uncharacterized protein n=1 Tax=Candida tenuis (strain ATCC 10573 / BCRC 21748 / CBS 615 / JCM 9827 / NBRC 10315 / NRRL Y-1498 / VKM Y-70) TaxID=590646 RepID=G3BC81_CANTC|nr:uncharacterized protein CANTEDRAFT_116162 [Yamadazyma tenuis ATCC 10573]XP_006690241.1 uncharacterized protein CANTEDRAFT_116162 [Yamadazyma tenuis ATCC 10573]EGV61026.1 hypothetical protein CANTEDRAFT_116162 [Yamadazyma tenuis ATCC 10573]EGV61027.1 hypothetical protein CANTEDRAFT_116162 [Yamadazyma tenuis ATCC 10573]WEJ94623.1 hypothetical protein PSN45_002114 [Yamadazyma tenuis]
MGICLSCLRPSEEDDEYNERSSLLRSQDFYSDEHLQEELLKKQQRQQELNNIVNELSENLIDVSTFMSNSTLQSSSTPNTPNINEYGASQDKQYPYSISPNERAKILEEVENLDPAVKEACKVEVKDSLYLTF